MKPRKRKTSLWDPERDGITNSLLGRWIVCRERFRLNVVEGLRQDEGLSEPLEYGNLWHEAEEAHCGGENGLKAMEKYRNKLLREFPDTCHTDIWKLYKVASLQWPVYLDYWRDHPDERQRTPILEEKSFRVEYELPSGRVITLRGKFDALLAHDNKVLLQENKTKSRIDVEALTKTLDRNIQTMVYQTALRGLMRGEGTLDDCPMPDFSGMECEGVLYNVIKRPNVGGNYGMRQLKGREVNKKDAHGKDVLDKKGNKVKVRKGAETEKAFYKRVGEQLRAKASEYFFRWHIELTDDDVALFQQQTLNPILESLLDWWDSIKHDPFDPWLTLPDYDPSYHTPVLINDQWMWVDSYGDVEGEVEWLPNRQHWQTPWGVYNSLAAGLRGDFFEYIVNGSVTGLTQTENLFPELS